MNSVADVWDNVLSQLKGELSETTIATWFDELEAVDIQGNTFILHCSNDFKKGYIESLFMKNIKASLHDIFSTDFEVKILDDLDYAELKDNRPHRQSERFTSAEFTFETFVVGPSNKLAYAASVSVADYPELPMVEDDFSVSIQQKLLRAMIEETAFAVSTNESRPIHTGALFEITDQGLTMVAVDGFRLAIRREPLEKIDGGAFSFVAPGSALGEVKNICSDVEDLAAVTLGKSHILFEVGDTELICRRLEGEFLDYKNAIPRKNPISVIADTKALIESIDRVSVVISEKQKSPVRCLFDHDKVLLSAKTGNGEAKDICRLSGDGGGLEIGFNNRYLMEALRYAPADTVKIELNTGVSPAIIVPTEGEENFLYMVLPVRLKSAE